MFSKARDREGQHRGYAHVDFESKQDAVKVFEDHSESPITIEDRELRVGHAYPTRASSLRMRTVKDRFDPSSHIFVGKLPYEATREDIREALKRFGLITDVRVGALTYGTSQPNHMLNLGSCSTRRGRDIEGIRTRRVCEYR